MIDVHLSSANMKCARQFRAHAKGILRAGPDGQVAILPFRDRRARFERRVLDVRDMVCPAQRFSLRRAHPQKDLRALRLRRSV